MENIKPNIQVESQIKMHNSTNKNSVEPKDVDNEKGLKHEKDDLIRHVREILNKLTPENFDALLKEIMCLKIDNNDKMQAVMELVFETAIDEPSFSESCARLCHRLITEVMRRDDEQGGSSNVILEKGTKTHLSQFRSALLDKTEKEFTNNVVKSADKELKLQPIIDKIKLCKDPSERTDLESLLDEEESKIRRRSNGIVRFMGELYKIGMLTSKIITQCIDILLSVITEDHLECLCTLLITVGARYESSPRSREQPQRFNNLDEQIARMQALVDTNDEDAKISSHVRFILQNVIDLRKNKWLSKRNEAPKTMQQIKKEIKSEQMSAHYLAYNTPLNSSSSSSSLSASAAGSGTGGSNSQIGQRRPHKSSSSTSRNNNFNKNNENADDRRLVQNRSGKTKSLSKQILKK